MIRRAFALALVLAAAGQTQASEEFEVRLARYRIEDQVFLMISALNAGSDSLTVRLLEFESTDGRRDPRPVEFQGLLSVTPLAPASEVGAETRFLESWKQVFAAFAIGTPEGMVDTVQVGPLEIADAKFRTLLTASEAESLAVSRSTRSVLEADVVSEWSNQGRVWVIQLVDSRNGENWKGDRVVLDARSGAIRSSKRWSGSGVLNQKPLERP